MAEVKDKVVTVESLAAVHAHNQNVYMAKTNPNGSGTLSIDGDGSFTGSIDANSLVMGNAVLSYDTTENILRLSFLVDETESESTE